jgi:hypothetical protein
LDYNKITATVNSRGNFAFNDFESNLQGEGFCYDTKKNLLYEGAFMVAQSSSRISNVARSEYDQTTEDRDFVPVLFAEIDDSSSISAKVAHCEFTDANAPTQAGVSVKQKVYQFTIPNHDNYIITCYDITNQTDANIPALYAGLFLDWDIGTSGRNDVIKFDDTTRLAYAYNFSSDTMPFAGVALLSNYSPNMYAINNDGTSGSINLYNGFARTDKWLTLSGGILRSTAQPGDVSMVISNGPISINSKETKRIAFALLGGKNLNDLYRGLDSARAMAERINIIKSGYNPPAKQDAIVSISPNPAFNGSADAIINLSQEGQITLEIYNILGAKVAELPNQSSNFGSNLRIHLPLENLPIGYYFLRLKTQSEDISEPFVIVM